MEIQRVQKGKVARQGIYSGGAQVKQVTGYSINGQDENEGGFQLNRRNFGDCNF